MSALKRSKTKFFVAFGYKSPVMLKFVNNVTLNNFSISGKIQACFKHMHSHTPHLCVCVCECIYVSVDAWIVLWKIVLISSLLRGVLCAIFF